MSDILAENKRTSGFFGMVERIGNKIPHTLTLFIYLTICLIILSILYAVAGIRVIHPVSGETIAPINLFSKDGLMLFLTAFTSSFQKFPILGITITVGLGMGLCDASGTFSAIIKLLFKRVNNSWLAFSVTFVGVFMCSLDGSVSMIIVPALAAAIYKAAGKNPLIGLFCGYAAACSGAALEFVPAFWQVCLTPMTVKAAQLYDPNFTMPLMSDYYAVLFSSSVLVLVTTFVTIKFVAPRFAVYNEADAEEGFVSAEAELTDTERCAAKKAIMGVAVYFALIFVACIPASSFFRAPSGSLVIDAPFMWSMENLLVFFFFIPGYIYAKNTGQAKTIGEMAELTAKGAYFILPVLIIFVAIALFLAFFQLSNLGPIISIQIADTLKSLAVPPQVTVATIFIFVALVGVFITSGSSKYIIFAPIFIPLLMQFNIHPAFGQYIMRMADVCGNNISPLMAFFPVVVVMAQKYDRKVGVGTMFSAMLPYTISYVVILLTIVLLWMTLDLPLGLAGGRVWL
ncbi:MAG: AbgT family transporter [Cloacibacillus sp.]